MGDLCDKSLITQPFFSTATTPPAPAVTIVQGALHEYPLSAVAAEAGSILESKQGMNQITHLALASNPFLHLKVLILATMNLQSVFYLPPSRSWYLSSPFPMPSLSLPPHQALAQKKVDL